MSKIYEEHITRRYYVECMGEPCDVLADECCGLFCDFGDTPVHFDGEFLEKYIYIKGRRGGILPFPCECPRDDEIFQQTRNDEKVEKLEEFIKQKFPDVEFDKEYFKDKMKRFGKYESEG